MILSSIVLVGLLVATASGSAIKGREEYATKGGGRQLVAPIEYQRQYYEQREAYAKGQEVKREEVQQAPEQTKLTDSDLYQQREETKGDKQQFYEAQPQLREERLVQLPEVQTKYEDYQQQREEAPAAPAKQAVKSVVKQEENQVKVQQREETKQVAYEKQQFYEAKPQVREEVPLAIAAPVKGLVKAEQVYSKADEQVQYVAQAPVEQSKLEEVQRVEEYKGEKKETQREELKSTSAKAATVQRVEEAKFEQERLQAPQQQQVVELTKQDYEQRRLEEQTEQRSDEQFSQVREEQVKGGLRPAGAEAEPYAFDYSVEGSSRRESGDKDGVVRGQYTIQNQDGSQRIVDYVADRDGFRAQVQTNEFGTENQQPANVGLRTSQPTAESLSLRLDGKTRELVAAAPQPQVLAVKSAQPLVQVAEVSRTKTAYVESRASSASSKGPEPQLELRTPLVVAHEPVPYKGQRVEEAPVQSYQQRQVEPTKSAEIRAPKAISGQLKSSSIITRASGFESATAHRPVVHSYPTPVVRHVQSPAPVVRHQLIAPVRSHHHQHYHQHHAQSAPVASVGVSRSQLQHDRYPPASYRRDQLVNPRVSFYANNFEEEQPAGFEHPAADLV